jgi:hypothetical protein
MKNNRKKSNLRTLQPNGSTNQCSIIIQYDEVKIIFRLIFAVPLTGMTP